MKELLELKNFTEENIMITQKAMSESNDITEFKIIKMILKRHIMYLEYINRLINK